MPATIVNLPWSAPPVSDQVTASLAEKVVTAVWFSLTLIAEAASPAAPLGPVISGAVLSTAVKSTLAVLLIASPLTVPEIVAVSTVFEEVKVAV